MPARLVADRELGARLREQVDPLHRVPGDRRDARETLERRQIVDVESQTGVRRADGDRRRRPLVREHHRHAHALVVRHDLAAPVMLTPEEPVVAHEEDIRVVGYRVPDRAHGAVDAVDRVLLRDVLHVRLRSTRSLGGLPDVRGLVADIGLPVGRGLAVRPLEPEPVAVPRVGDRRLGVRRRRMRALQGQIEQERLAGRRALDERLRLLREHPAGVARRIRAVERRARSVVRGVVVVVPAGSEREPGVPPGRDVAVPALRISVQVLADQRGPVAGRVEVGGDRAVLVAVGVEAVEAAEVPLIGPDPGRERIVAGQGGRSGGTAQRVGTNAFVYVIPFGTRSALRFGMKRGVVVSHR